ncbi:reverse transcriptase [Elysia marginata]|uniref:Reverse transcriptase n=1 Tax=Elysia marginata TaxID=1093978 RepID=A0AAV4GR87_9GAST|nr:reverse transcriptase [Elysia marginata]
MYHVPEDIQVMLDDYFSGFRMRFSSSDYTTHWINLELSVFKGRSISPILFVMTIEVILKSLESSAGPANLGGGRSMPHLKAFMDDTTIMGSKEDETWRMLARHDTLMAWCRMKIKPKKSRSLSTRKAKWWSKTEGKEKRDMTIDEVVVIVVVVVVVVVVVPAAAVVVSYGYTSRLYLLIKATMSSSALWTVSYPPYR